MDASSHNDPTTDDRIGAFHRDAADTERDAAVSQYPKIGGDRRRVLEFIASCGAHGATDDEVAAGTGLYLYTAAPRRVELVNAGLVVRSGERRQTPRKRRAIVWVARVPFLPGEGL